MAEQRSERETQNRVVRLFTPFGVLVMDTASLMKHAPVQ